MINYFSLSKYALKTHSKYTHLELVGGNKGVRERGGGMRGRERGGGIVGRERGGGIGEERGRGEWTASNGSLLKLKSGAPSQAQKQRVCWYF